jgi:hypothetical protein
VQQLCVSARICFALVVAALLGAATAARADVIQNGGFETGDFTGWSAAGDMDVTNATQFGLSAYQGQYYAQAFNGADILDQTVTDTANQQLTLTFYVANVNITGSVGTFFAYWNNQLLAQIITSQTFGWTEYSYTVMATGSDTLTFLTSQSLPGSFWAIDGVTGIPQSVPEPGTLALVGTGLITAGFLRRGRSVKRT